MNTADEATLTIKYWKGHLVMNRYDGFNFPGEEPRVIKQQTFKVDLDVSKNIIWKINEENKFKSSDIKEVFSCLIKSLQKEKEKKFRK